MHAERYNAKVKPIGMRLQGGNMEYAEIVQKALRGRSVNRAAKEWGVGQVTLNRYVNGGRLPDYETAVLMAREAGVEPGVMLIALAEEESRRKRPIFRAAAAVASAAVVIFSVTTVPSPAEAGTAQIVKSALGIMSNRRRALLRRAAKAFRRITATPTAA